MKYDDANIFARIIKGEIPCKKVYEDELVIAFHDISPSAPVHILILPKGNYCSFDDFVLNADEKLVKHFYLKIREIAHSLGLERTGYRLIMNHGADACQTVNHYHVHLLGKKPLGALVVGDSYHG
ncbi:MAG: histidine triad nucleotide-binding protein [Candidatus Jidaibacter sp.]|jgi:histidine triad (HIT) family protein|nr:histidine triad nucleotide-binding protein [Candidatus Jidaibacter sp.]